MHSQNHMLSTNLLRGTVLVAHRIPAEFIKPSAPAHISYVMGVTCPSCAPRDGGGGAPDCLLLIPMEDRTYCCENAACHGFTLPSDTKKHIITAVLSNRKGRKMNWHSHTRTDEMRCEAVSALVANDLRVACAVSDVLGDMCDAWDFAPLAAV
jgi:hypothetical protein